MILCLETPPWFCKFGGVTGNPNIGPASISNRLPGCSATIKLPCLALNLVCASHTPAASDCGDGFNHASLMGKQTAPGRLGCAEHDNLPKIAASCSHIMAVLHGRSVAAVSKATALGESADSGHSFCISGKKTKRFELLKLCYLF